MKLLVVIVSYNVKHYVEQCLNSLRKAIEGIDSHVVVVDNHSKDGSVEYLSKRFSDVEMIDSNRNLGFARANNMAIRQTESDYVLLLNPDTVVGENTLRKALAFMDNHPQAGSLGVRMQNADGSLAMESRRGLPTPFVSLYKMCGLCQRYPQSRRFAHYYMSYLPWDSPQRIEVVSGAFCLLRREALDKVGLLDEDFFMYGEDIDLSCRLLKGGYENWYVPLPLLHYKGESTEKSSFRYVHVFYNAMLIFLRKHYGHLSFCLTMPIQLAIYAKAAVTLLTMQAKRARRSLGFYDTPTADPLYVFIGQRSMIDRCRTVARRKALTSIFCEADEDSFCEEAISQTVLESAKGDIYYVFDTAAFSYEAMLEAMRQPRCRKALIGIYNTKTKTITTPNDTIR